MEKTKLLFLILAVVTVWGSCGSGNRKVAVSPPTSKVPPPESLPVQPQASSVPEVKPKPPDPATVLISQVDAIYNEGLKDYHAGKLEQAKQDFDKALSLLLESGMDVQSDSRLNAEFDKLVENTYGLEASASANGDTLSQHDYEPPPIESFAGLTFPVDPRVRQRAERELISVRSDLPLVSNDYVAGFLTYFQNHGQGYIEKILTRVGMYQPMISSILRKYGLPQDLIYMAAAESGFNPLAVSRAGATGIWQFMASRAREYGLKLNQYEDQREDPLRSTDAAARHLRDLYKEFGDWYLAMAAYDAGPMNVQRAIERTGYANYWKLRELHALPEETQNYVPIFIATALIGKDPRAYGFDVQPDPPLDPDPVTVTVPTDLRLVAELIDQPVKELERLNPSLLTWATPGDQSQYVLNLPRGTRNLYEKRIAAVPPAKRVWWRAVKVEQADTLSAIARKYRVTRTALAEANHLDPGDDPEIGAHLILPLPPGREPLYRRGERLSHYRIRRGDTLGAIAARFHVTVASLRRWNHLRGSQIAAGRTLQVFGHGNAISGRSGEYHAELSGGVRTYRIQQGDSLGAISRHFHVSVADLRRWNHLTGSSIVAGRTLKLSGARSTETSKVASSSPVKSKPSGVYHYRIRRGDTLAVIADRFKVSIAQIREWNHLDGSVIMPGQVLALHGVSE
ncbi:MAG TPA: LysM peptidoglycan-binding domain-containing protein [Terriglobia bacterium]|nr:LysM peptidoglycan-binding domain-containing protein [Terriglobia bacterium]